MKRILSAAAVIKAAQFLATGETAAKVLIEASHRAEETADMLEKLDKSIPEVEDDKVPM